MISGTTRLIAHIGVPTESFKAPLIYNPWFERCGADVVVAPMGCEAADFAVFLRAVARLRNFAGALITMPHKAAVVPLLDEASAAVSVCGACNAVRRDADGRLIGDMFDGEGFVRGAVKRLGTLRGASALVVGSGGAGSAIAASLAKAGAARLGLFDVDADRAAALAERLAARHPALVLNHSARSATPPDPRGWDVVVNATPLGMRPDDPAPLDADRLDPSSYVGDVVLSVAETPFLAAARARGCATQIGLDMLFEQIPAYLEFFGLPPASAETLRRLANV